MGEALAAPPYLLSSHNAAIGGYDTNRSMDQLNEALAAHAPRVVVIGLSLANEGLVGSTTMAEALAVMDSFVSGLQALIARAEAAGASVMLGGVRRAPSLARPHSCSEVRRSACFAHTGARPPRRVAGLPTRQLRRHALRGGPRNQGRAQQVRAAAGKLSRPSYQSRDAPRS